MGRPVPPSRPDPRDRRRPGPPEPVRASRAELARARAARLRRRPRLSLDAIVTVALRIVDEEGVGQVSMRRVAAEFDTGPASLYAYVATKDDLLRMALDRVIGEIPLPPHGPWQQMARTWALSTREVFARHGDIARVSFAHVPSAQDIADGAELMLGAMIGGGVPPQVAAWALDIIALYVAADALEGWMMAERFGGDDPEQQGQDFVESIAAQFAELPPERYPNLVTHMDAMMTGSSDERFEFGIDTLLAGIAARIP